MVFTGGVRFTQRSSTGNTVDLHGVYAFRNGIRYPGLWFTERAAMSDLFVLLDGHSRVKCCSDTVYPILGISPDEVMGQALPELLLRRFSSEVTEETLSALLELIDGAPAGVSSVELVCSGPQRREYVATVYPISFATEGIMTGLTIRDITEERETQRRKDAFVAVISHELRDPITAIMGFSRLLLETGNLNATQREWLENIQTCGDRLATITCDMLDVVGLRTGNLMVSQGPADLRPAIDEALLLLGETCGKVECKVDLPSDIPQLQADGTRLLQVLRNLLSNAVKYSPQGGQVRVWAHHEIERGRVVVAVADQGMGIAPQEMEDIFLAFQRSQRPEANGVKGAGLGLYIVKGLVELMQGEVWVESQVGRGSTFYVALPVWGELARSRQCAN